MKPSFRVMRDSRVEHHYHEVEIRYINNPKSEGTPHKERSIPSAVNQGAASIGGGGDTPRNLETKVSIPRLTPTISQMPPEVSLTSPRGHTPRSSTPRSNTPKSSPRRPGGSNRNPGYESNAFGFRNTSSGFASLAQGKESIARLRTQIAHASGSFVYPGDAQYTTTILKARNTESSTSQFKLDDIEDYLIGNIATLSVNINLFGSASDARCFSGNIKCLVSTDQSGGVIIEHLKKNIDYAPPGWGVDLFAFNDDLQKIKGLMLTARVAESDIPGDIRWTAYICSFEHTR